jgi:hypothetical protein
VQYIIITTRGYAVMSCHVVGDAYTSVINS